MTGQCSRSSDTNCIVVTALDSDLDHFNSVAAGLDVEITAMTKSTPQVGINGPRSKELLQSICEADVSSLRYFRFWPEQVQVGGVPCWVSRTGYSGELGFELFCSPDGAEQLWAAVVGAGARPYGLSAVETIRIESGLIFIGYDYFQHETSPYDMSLDKMIRLDGPDFCGKAALAAEAGSPPRRLVTLVLDGGDVPEYGAAVTKDGEPVGTLTSPCESPTLGQVIGMAVLDAGHAAIGERVDVALGDGVGRGGGRLPAGLRPREEAAAHVAPSPRRDAHGEGGTTQSGKELHIRLRAAFDEHILEHARGRLCIRRRTSAGGRGAWPALHSVKSGLEQHAQCVRPRRAAHATSRPSSRAVIACSPSRVTKTSGSPSASLSSIATARWMASRVPTRCALTTSRARRRTGSARSPMTRTGPLAEKSSSTPSSAASTLRIRPERPAALSARVTSTSDSSEVTTDSPDSSSSSRKLAEPGSSPRYARTRALASA